MDSPIVWERSPAMNVRSTGKHRSRSPTVAETQRTDDLLSLPILTRTSTDDLCSTDAALIVALTSLSRGTSEMKTPVQEALTPYTKSSLTDDLTLPDLLRVTSSSDILTQRLQCTTSMDELPLLTPNLGKFPSTISTCSDIIKPEPIRLSDMNQSIPEIQVIDPSMAPLDMGRMESISGDATAITAENVTHANDEQNGDDEIARAAELIRAASETTDEEMPSLEDDGEQDVDKLESSARPHYHRSSLTVLPMVRTASNPDALPDEMNALASEENDVRAEQRVQEMLDQPDLLRNSTGNSMNEEKRGIVSIDHLDSQLSLLHQHLDNDTHKRRHYDPLIHVAIKRTRLDESMSGYGKSGFKPVIRTNTSHFTSLIPSSSSILSPTSLIPSSIISPTHTLIPSTSIISPTHTLIPSFTRSFHTLSPRLPTATNLTSLITASHSNAQRGASTSFASFSSTTSVTPSQSAPVSTSSSPSPPPVARPIPKRRTKKPISPKSETDSHSSTSTSPSQSPRSISSRDAIVAQSSHADGDYECKECGKKFTTQSRMQIHYRTHGVGTKPFACEHCGQQFNHKGSLTRHIRTHGGEKPYECTICHKRFFQTGNLTVHFRTHTGEKPFECSECGKRFNHRSSLTVHFRGHF